MRCGQGVRREKRFAAITMDITSTSLDAFLSLRMATIKQMPAGQTGADISSQLFHRATRFWSYEVD
jgi:hypothetical protein